MCSMTAAEFLRPTPVALYRHVDLNGELLYVGITTDPDRRWAQHREMSFWARFVADTSVHWLEDRDAARRAERRSIAFERPLFNQARPAAASQELEHQLAYLRTGVSGLPRRSRCRDYPEDFCRMCGPDADAWLESTMEQTA